MQNRRAIWRYFALVFVPIYALIIYVRHRLFDIGILKSMPFKTPIICVGNLSLGGTGKTPMVEYIIRTLHDMGLSYAEMAVLSRGYGRKTKGTFWAKPEHSVEQTGDEPLQIIRKFPGLHLVLDANRQRGMKELEKACPGLSLVIMDDAFQHRYVKARYTILLTEYAKPYSDDYLLPFGNLRDLKQAAARADSIVLTKCPNILDEGEKIDAMARLKIRVNQKIFFSSLDYGDLYPKLSFSLNDPNRESLIGISFLLFTGIANPKPLLSYLQGLGVEIKHMSFPDHHYFTDKEIKKIEKSFEQVKSSQKYILTTEKDYVRLDLSKFTHKVYYIPLLTCFLADEETNFRSVLQEII